MRIKKHYKELNYIHYSNCHEDADLLLSYVPKDAKNILSVASALDNSLALLSLPNVIVTAFDYNPSQIMLCKLKKKAIEIFTYEEFMIFIGIWEGDILTLYQKLRFVLEAEVVDYFDHRIYLLKDIKLIHCGKFEYYLQIFKKKIFPLVVSKKRRIEFMNLSSLTEQRDYYQKYINNIRFKIMFKVFFSKFIMKRKGRDKLYFKYNHGSLSKMLKERFELGISNHLNNENPYLNYVLLNTYKTYPFYLKEDNFYQIKKNIVNLRIIEGEFCDFLQQNVKYDFMNLSDIFEYMNASQMETLEEKILCRLNPKGRVVFWNMMNTRIFQRMQRINTKEDLIKDKAFYYKDVLVYENK